MRDEVKKQEKMAGNSERPRCPYEECPSNHSDICDVVVHSRKLDKIRYCCKVCGRTFSLYSHRLGKEKRGKSQSEKYALWLFTNEYSVSEIAYIIGVSKRTVYRWVKKFEEEHSEAQFGL